MTERGRDIVIGLFVLLGLAVLGLLIIKFNTAVDYFGGMRNYYIEIRADKTAAVLAGQTVHMNGYPIGEIKSVRLADDPRQGVIITAAIGQNFGIPQDVDTVYIYQAQLGPPWIEIRVLPTNSDVMYPTTPGQVVATFEASIPPDPFSQISQLAEQLKPTLQELGPALARLSALAESLSSVISDQQNRDNLRQSLANLSQAGRDASEALQEFKAFSAQARQSTSELSLELRDAGQAVIENSQQISQLLSHLDQAVQQVNQGQGTAGKVLYDPALYEEMLSSTENLNEAIHEFRTLLNKWSREGLKVKW